MFLYFVLYPHVYTIWLRIVDDVRTKVVEAEYIFIPDLNI